VEDLLYVGKATKKKLNSIGIKTIGEIANTSEKVLRGLLGAWGSTLYKYANGQDESAVESRADEETKSIGNSLTDYKDLYDFEEVKVLLMLLSDSVASRLRESGLGKAKTVKVTVTDNTLQTFGKQMKLKRPTASAVEIASASYELFSLLYDWKNPVRGAGVSVSDFTLGTEQLSMDFVADGGEKLDKLEHAVDDIRKKYGHSSVQYARVLEDKKLSKTEIKGEAFDKGL
jgi:DNA polymerase-4